MQAMQHSLTSGRKRERSFEFLFAYKNTQNTMLKTKEKARLYGLASYSLLLLLLSLSATKHVTHMGSSSIVQLTNHHNYLPH